MSARDTKLWPRPLRLLRLAWTTGAFAHPAALARRLYHRKELGRLSRSMFYFRWATALLLAHDIGLLNALRTGPRRATEVAAELDVHPRSLDALARILEAEGLIVRHAGELELSAFARAFLVEGAPESMAPMLDLMAAQAHAFAEVGSGMRDGRVPRVLDVTSEAGRYSAFLDAVNAYLDPAVRELLSKVLLPDVRDLIVGSMGVSASAAILERFPSARVTYGCLPHLVREIPRLRDRFGVPPARVVSMHEHGGDPEADRWGTEAYDLVLLTKKMILAPDARLGERFAQKAFQVLRPGGVVVLWECVHPDAGATPIARAMEAVMDLAASPQAPANSEKTFEGLLTGIGYREVEVVSCLEGDTTFVVARKPRDASI